MKTNPENQIGKRFENKLNDYSANFEPAINQVENYLKAVKEAQEAQAKIDASRSAQKAENEKIAKDALETYQNDLKRENERLRAIQAHSKNNDVEKKIDRDNDLSF